MIDIKCFQQLCANDTIIITKHAGDRLIERNILYASIKSGIMNGKIIESYPDDYPNPSVLIMGYTDECKPIHIVAGLGEGIIQVITAYTPTIDRWEDDLITRKVNQ